MLNSRGREEATCEPRDFPNPIGCAPTEMLGGKGRTDGRTDGKRHKCGLPFRSVREREGPTASAAADDDTLDLRHFVDDARSSSQSAVGELAGT